MKIIFIDIDGVLNSMKKYLLALFVTLLLIGCSDSPEIIADVKEADQMNSKFERHRLDDCYSILVEKESGVCYFECKERVGYGGYYGISVMLNSDGTPKIWEE